MKRILLVDPHGLFRQSLARILEISPRIEAEVWQASSAEEARAHLASGAVDAALVDLESPDGAGAGLVREMSAADPRVPVLVLSTVLSPEANPSWSAQAREAGAEGVLSKTGSLEEVVGAVERLLGG